MSKLLGVTRILSDEQLTANLNEKNLSTNSPWGFEANLDTIDPK